jgi:hypothetical protein
MGFTSNVVFQHLHQARFPNTGLTLQHYHLAHAFFDPCPALHQQPYFWCPSYQRRQAAGRSNLEATLYPTGL